MKSLVLTAAFLLVAGFTAAQALPNFTTAAIKAGGNIRGIASADFNGDGHLDFATADDSSPSEISVFLGAGDGTFTLNGRVPVPAGAFGIASADFNHDGRADLVVTSADSNAISILLWTSSGFIVSQTLTSPGGDPRFVVAADFNRDGNPDIAYASFVCGCVESWTSNRTGDAWTMVGQIKTGKGAHGLAVGDFNLDGELDLVVTNSLANTVCFLSGFGNGNFFVAGKMATGGDPRSVTVGDFNHDGLSDFAVVNTSSHSVSVFLGVRGVATAPDAAFFGRTLPETGFSSPRDIIAVDVNGDSDLDLVVASDVDNKVWVLTGDGDGHFGSQEKRFTTTVASPSGPRALAFGDYNEDGRIDLLSANQNNGTVTVITNNTAFSERPN